MLDKTKEKELFEDSSVFSAVMRLALPSVIGQIILVIYNIADTFFVGLTGSDTMITSVTVCMPAFMFLSAISNLFGVGGASVISRSLGQKKADRARHASRFAFWGCAVITLLYSLGVWLFMDGFVDILGGSAPDVHINSREYMMAAVVIGGIPTAINTLCSHLVRAEGRSAQASIGIAIGGVLNIALDPLFMFVILPKGNEALGAAIATMLSNVCALIYYAIVILKDRRKLVLSVMPRKAMFSSKIPQDIVISGIPACLMTLCENISYAVLDNLMSAVGTAAQAGIGVAKKINMLAHCTVRGMSQGVLPLIGYSFAAGNKKRMKSTVYLSASISIAFSLLCMAACLLFSRPLIGIFIQSESHSLTYGATFLRILCIGAPFSALAYTVISFFQATGHGLRSLVLALMRKGVLDIPMMFILPALFFSPDKYPGEGIVWATPIADIICCVAALIMMIHFLRTVPVAPKSEEKEEISYTV